MEPFNGYRTVDGKFFQSQAEAVLHEARLQVAEAFTSIGIAQSTRLIATIEQSAFTLETVRAWIAAYLDAVSVTSDVEVQPLEPMMEPHPEVSHEPVPLAEPVVSHTEPNMIQGVHPSVLEEAKKIVARRQQEGEAVTTTRFLHENTRGVKRGDFDV